MTNCWRQYQEAQADIAAMEAYREGIRPLPHQPHDPQFLRMYDQQWNVTLVDVESGEESRPFRVHYEEREQQEWMRVQKSHRS